MDKVQSITNLFLGFPNAKLDPPVLAVYLMVLKEVPAEELEVLVMQCLSRPGAFPPSAGDLLDQWRTMKGAIPGADAAVRGWLAVLESLRSFPATVLKDPIAVETVKAMGGISTLRRSETPSLDRRDFIRMYEAIARAKTEEARETAEYKRLAGGGKLLERKDD